MAEKIQAGSGMSIQTATMMTELDKGSSSTSFDGNFVLAFARLRLQALDSWLSRTQNNMDLATKRTQALNDAAAEIARYIQGFKDGDAAAHANIQNKLNEVAAKLPAGDAVGDKLKWLANDPHSILNESNGVGAWDDKCSAEDIASLQKQVESMMKSVDSNSQMDSMQVNQKMGERGEVLQLASTLIQMMNESSKSIIQHMG